MFQRQTDTDGNQVQAIKQSVGGRCYCWSDGEKKHVNPIILHRVIDAEGNELERVWKKNKINQSQL